MLWRWAWRELTRNWKISLFFIFNLSLGLMGFIALQSYKTALQNHIQENRREILGADLAISVRREFTEAEVATANQVLTGSQASVIYDFFAMVATPQGSRLVLVKAVDDAYPLYGELQTPSRSPVRIHPGEIWSFPELQNQFRLKEGDRLKLGELELPLKGIISFDSTQTFRAAGIAPRVFIHRDLLTASGLIRFGSTFTKTLLYRLPAGADSKALQKTLYDEIKDPAVQIETADGAGEDSGRQMGLLSDYLGLVALVALFMAGLGAAYIWRLFLQQRTKEIAIFRSLGLDASSAVSLYVIEAAILGTLALIPALVGAQLVFPLLNRLLTLLTPFELRPILTWTAVFSGWILSLGTSLLVTLPFLLKLREIRPARLFNEDKFVSDLQIRRPWAFLPAILALWGLSFWQAHSFFAGTLFMACLLGVLVFLGFSGWLLMKALSRVKPRSWEFRNGLRGAARRPASSLAIFISLGLGSLLMNILPQVKNSLQHELQVDGPTKVPSLFLFDIQDEQVEPLKAWVAEKNLTLRGLSPLIRSRLIQMNGQNYERRLDESVFRTREEEREARFRNRGINLSSRATLSDSEDLVEGRSFSGRWDPASGKRVELSVEMKYAERMGFKIGDVLKFDIEGVEIEGEVINLRRVRWTSFQPNFFILIQDGVLEDAPKTWIAGLPRMDTELKTQIQSEIVQKFPNVSAVDVARAVDDVLVIGNQMSWSMELMASLALLTGAVVLFSIVRSQVRQRRWELNLLKIMGATSREVRRSVSIEFLVLCGIAAFVGSFLSPLIGTVLLHQIFDLGVSMDLSWPFITTILVSFMGWIVTRQAASSVLNERAIQLLRDGDGT